jgi:hypothetical protein
MVDAAKIDRCDRANRLVEAVASTGRRFFRHDDRVGRFEVDARGHIWFVDAYSGRRVYTHYGHKWRGFSDGGTLRDFIEQLRDFIAKGERMEAWYFEQIVRPGNFLGYGPDADAVHRVAREAGIAGEVE